MDGPGLFQFFARVWPRLASGLPVPFQLEGGFRRDATPAHEALREAFVNALIHADYTTGGGVILERHADRFVVENPGILLVSLEQYVRGGVSECRNKAIQQMFLMIGGGERAGSGADRIRSGWRTQRWRAPQISLQDGPDRVRLVLPMVSLIPDSTLERLRGIFGARIDALTPSEVQALATADIESTVSNVRLQELLADHPVDISRMLQGLCTSGFLVSDNRRRWTTYRLEGPQPRASATVPGDSSPLAGDSSSLARDSSPLAGDSSPLLAAIAAPVAGTGKATIEVVKRTIIELCTRRYLSAVELGLLLRRNPARLRSRFLSPMVREGLLDLRFPEAPNRPDQAYTTIEHQPLR